MTPNRDAVVQTMQIFYHDKVACSGATDLVEAAKMQWTTGGRPAEIEAAVLRHVHVIERIAKRVASHRTPAPEEEQSRRRIVDDLARDLRRQSTDLAVRHIKDAVRALERNDSDRLAHDIAYTCTELQLHQDVRTDALNLNKLRNQSLAHPGRAHAHQRLAEHSNAASGTAAAFLSGYVGWRAKTR